MRAFALACLLAATPAFAVAQTPAAGQAAVPPAEAELTIAAVGDIMLGHRAEPYLEREGPAYFFRNVLPVLQQGQVVIGNLESPVSNRGSAVPDKKFTLRVGRKAVDALHAAGIRVVTLANNHILDFGPPALQDTLTALAEGGILHSGAGMDLEDARQPAMLRTRGRTLAFLSYSLTFPVEFYASPGRPGTAPGYKDFVRHDIEKVRPKADLVIVSFHWGAELMTAAKTYQRELGRLAVDWGADLVLGHHPHVLQELELYRGRLIAYSLGNFVFGSESSRTNDSIILLCTFKGKSLVAVEAVPIDVNNYRVAYQPKVLTGTRADEVLGGLNAGSERLGARLDLRNGRGYLTVTAAPGN